MAVDTGDLEIIRQRLAAWLTDQMPQASDIVLSPLQRPGAGISNETYFCDLQWRQGGMPQTRPLVIRWPPSGFMVFPRRDYDMGRQFRLLQALGRTDIPVPPALWLEEDASVIGAPFYIMEKVAGWVPGDFPPYHAAGPLFDASLPEREAVWFNAVDTLARIHTLDWQQAGLGFLGSPASGTDLLAQQIAYYDEVFAQNQEPMPDVLRSTRDWLMSKRFTPRHVGLCWGDARLGNLLLQGQRVAAVLDWEMASLGDPESDLGWFAHIDWATSVGRAKSPLPRLAGLPDLAQTIARYERATGRQVEHLHYHEVFATWRMAILFTRIEQDPNYLARSGNAKGFITWTHLEKLQRLLAA